MQWIKTTGRWCYRAFWYSLVGLIISIAIGISLLRIYLPDVKAYREEIELFASELLDKQVRIASMDAKLSGYTPLIIFDDVYLLDNKGERTLVHFDQALLTIDFIRSVFNAEIVPESFTIIGVDLGLRRKANGNFTIQGLTIDELSDQFTFPGGTKGTAGKNDNELATWLFERSKLAIKQSTVVWQDSINREKIIRFDNVNFDLRNEGTRHQLSGTVTLPENLGRDFEIAFDFTGNILNPSEWFGKVYSKVDHVNLVNWGVKPQYQHASLEQGIVDLELWGDWNGGKLTSFTADVNARDFILNLGETQSPFQISTLAGLLDWKSTDQGWRINLSNFQYQGSNKLWPTSNMIVSYQKSDQKLTAHADYIRLDDVNKALIESRVLEKDFEKILTELTPAGELVNLYANYSLDKKSAEYSLVTRFKNLSIKNRKKLPGIQNATGEVWLNQNMGRLTLASNKSMVDIPYMFREPFQVDSLSGQVDWYSNDYAWFIHADSLHATSPDINADTGVHAMIPKDGSSPYLDLQARYENGRAASVYKYLPVNIMDKKLVSWLDNAFKEGRVSEGGVIYNGRFSGFPYNDYSGTLLADFTAKNVKLHYQDEWPDIQVNNADLAITGLGLEISSDNSRLYNSKLSDVLVKITDFSEAALQVSGRSKGPSSDLAKFLVNTPIAPEANGFVNQSRLTGKYKGKAEFNLPLSNEARKRSPFKYKGRASLNDNELNLWQGSLVASRITGDINFSEQGVSSDNLSYEVLNGKATARIHTELINNKQDIKFITQGKLDTALLRKYINSSMVHRIDGKTGWQATVDFGSDNQPGFVQFFSCLEGVQVDLPSPFTKSKETQKALEIKVLFPVNEKLPIHVNYSHEVSSVVVLNLDSLDRKPLDRGEIVFSFEQFGEQIKKDVAVLPKTKELLIRGRLLDLPLDHWLTIVNEDVKSETVGLTSLNIPVRLDMDYLRLFTKSKENSVRPLEPAKDPRQIASFDGQIKTLIVNDIYIGNVRFKMEKQSDGLKFKELNVKNDNLQLEGEGGWYLRDNAHQTYLLLNMKSNNLGALLADLGYSAVLEGGETQAVVQANWNDSPQRFSMDKLNGSIGAVINDGTIKEVKPGAGRLLGLLSIAELPRRLLLDFSELGEGLTFKQIVGRIEIKDGDAFTDTVKIISPIALISIEGRTGLAARDFNQKIKVVPSVTGALPVISWIAWGGQIGALAFILDQMFGDQFNEEIATEYEVTGSWDNPQIKKITVSEPLDEEDVWSEEE